MNKRKWICALTVLSLVLTPVTTFADSNLAKRKDSQIEKLEAKVEQAIADAEKPLANVALGSVYNGVDCAVKSNGVMTLEDAGLLETSVREILMRKLAENKLPDLLYADTVSDRYVITRLSLVPSLVSAPIDLGLTLDETEQSKKIKESFSNELFVVDAAQEGSYGQTVEMMVRAEGVKSAENLSFYCYDPNTNLCNPATVSKVSLDEKGYLHFFVSSGGIYVIAQGELA